MKPLSFALVYVAMLHYVALFLHRGFDNLTTISAVVTAAAFTALAIHDSK